jgi:hypothetical protein
MGYPISWKSKPALFTSATLTMVTLQYCALRGRLNEYQISFLYSFNFIVVCFAEASLGYLGDGEDIYCCFGGLNNTNFRFWVWVRHHLVSVIASLFTCYNFLRYIVLLAISELCISLKKILVIT